MGIVEKIKEIEKEMSRTQKNKATEGNLGGLKVRPPTPCTPTGAGRLGDGSGPPAEPGGPAEDPTADGARAAPHTRRSWRSCGRSCRSRRRGRRAPGRAST